MSQPWMAEMARNAERGGKERAADRVAGRARIGGRLRQPDYLRSYLKAARILVQQARASDALNELAVTCAYLQRHALELAIKDLLDTLHTIADDTAHLDVLNHETASTAPIPPDERSRKTSCHDLEALRNDLDSALQRQAAGHDPIQMPPDLALLVSEFARIERKRPERFRYPTVPRKTQQGVPKAKARDRALCMNKASGKRSSFRWRIYRLGSKRLRLACSETRVTIRSSHWAAS